MLRVGLTGGLGSGKSTAARMFAALGADVLSSDEIGRALMQPGQSVYQEIVSCFGAEVVRSGTGGLLDRAALARVAFTDGRVEELNGIVHPAVISRQHELVREIGTRDPGAVVIVESALIFETNYGRAGLGSPAPNAASSLDWSARFDKLILVTAPEDVKVRRFIERSSADRLPTEADRAKLEEEAYRRMAKQIPDEQKAALCDYVLINGGPTTELEWQVDQLWPLLRADARSRPA